MIFTTLGERIRELRTAHDKSQVQLAQRLGVSKQSVSNWENGNAMPSVDMLVKIADFFSVTTDYLLGLEDRPFLNIEGLSSSQLAFVQRMIRYLQDIDD